MVDAVDSKSTGSDTVPVRVRSWAPFDRYESSDSFFYTKKTPLVRCFLSGLFCRDHEFVHERILGIQGLKQYLGSGFLRLSFKLDLIRDAVELFSCSCSIS